MVKGGSMTIGIDIDDTMTNTSELVIEYAKKYFNTNDSDELNKILHPKKLEGKILEFLYDCLPEMLQKYTLKDNVKEVIDRLRSDGHKVIIITVRAHSIDKGLIEISKEYFKKHRIIVDKMIFGQEDKTKACIENRVDIMVDDSLTVLGEIKNSNTKPLLFTSINNINIETDIERISNWLELEKHIKESL